MAKSAQPPASRTDLILVAHAHIWQKAADDGHCAPVSGLLPSVVRALGAKNPVKKGEI